MRINKYIANSGIASRRKADELIKAGKVKVNGKVMSQPGYDVADRDEVLVEGKPVQSAENKVYYAMNKPLGVITSVNDDRGRMTVVDIMSDVEERVFPVGRLDYNTSGLLLLTNDGDFANKIMHPGHRMDKTYRVRVAGNISKMKISVLRAGVCLGKFKTSPARVDGLQQPPRPHHGHGGPRPAPGRQGPGPACGDVPVRDRAALHDLGTGQPLLET